MRDLVKELVHEESGVHLGHMARARLNASDARDLKTFAQALAEFSAALQAFTSTMVIAGVCGT